MRIKKAVARLLAASILSSAFVLIPSGFAAASPEAVSPAGIPETDYYLSDTAVPLTTAVDCDCPAELTKESDVPRVIVFGDLRSVGGCSYCESFMETMEEIREDHSADDFEVYFFQIMNEDMDSDEYAEDISNNYGSYGGFYYIYDGKSPLCNASSPYRTLFLKCKNAAKSAGVIDGDSIPTPLVAYVGYDGKIEMVSAGGLTRDDIKFCLDSVYIYVDYDMFRISEERFPDQTFREYIESDLDCDCDGFLNSVEIDMAGGIYVDDLGVQDLTGIEYFTSLEILQCCGNDLYEIDVSNNTGLRQIGCDGNHLTSIDITNNDQLEYLSCDDNQLTAIDLSGNPVLTSVAVSGNKIKELDLSNNPDLYLIDCIGDPIETLDLSGNTEVTYLDVSGTKLTELDISMLKDLEFLYIEDTSIEQIDIHNNPHLIKAYKEGVVSNDKTHTRYDYDDYTYILKTNKGVKVVTEVSVQPTISPTSSPSGSPSGKPTGSPSGNPTSGPTSAPTHATGAIVPTVSPTTKPTAKPTSSPSKEGGVAGFVERLYTVALDRPSDANGKAEWIDAITSGRNTGADAARGFLYSTEFTKKGLSDEEFLRVLYRTFFDREADQGGLNAWLGVLANGESRANVIDGFINSTEWANLCVDFGILSGGTGVPTHHATPSQGTINFCTRLYTTCLDREADQSGLMAWAQVLADQKETGTGAAHGFFFSSEFINQGVSNAEYLTRLYRTFMDREPDPEGFNAWLEQLNSGVSREEVFNGFSQSTEFGNICKEYGIRR